ncbi:MAG: DUF2683 family protein [Candidatus Aenigmarchaeota archaeon]|nr:DUF2683 family protein [Candidatus Aenigmarchaeota archaeon]
MVKAIVNLDERSNRIINIVKAKYGLKDKSEAIEQITKEYEQELLEPEFKPEFVESVIQASKGKFKKVKNTSDLFR